MVAHLIYRISSRKLSKSLMFRFLTIAVGAEV